MTPTSLTQRLSFVAFWLQKRWYPQAEAAVEMVTAAQEACPPQEAVMHK